MLDWDYVTSGNEDRAMKLMSPLYATDDVPVLGNMSDAMLVYVQWVSNTSDDDAKCEEYFDQIRGDVAKCPWGPMQMGPASNGAKYVPVSQLMKGWVFTGVREHLCEWRSRCVRVRRVGGRGVVAAAPGLVAI